MQVTNILGETRDVVHSWADGSHQCPFCGYPACPECDNPCCSASKWATPANKYRFEEQARQAAERAAEEARRLRYHEIAMRRLEEDRRARDERARAFYAKVREAGGCMRCSDLYHERVRRHRGQCSKAKS